MPATHTIVLVHGGFVDGSGWQGVHNILLEGRVRVIVVQNPTISLADDVAGYQTRHRGCESTRLFSLVPL